MATRPASSVRSSSTFAARSHKPSKKSTLPDSFEVRVTSGEIAMGVKGNCLLCPLSIALGHSFPLKRNEQWSVNYTHAGICEKPFTKIADRKRLYAHDAHDTIRAFDNGELVQPFTVRFHRVGA